MDLIVMPRSFSSSRVSVKRISPAFAEAIMPAFETSESVRVDFPWSTRDDAIRILFSHTKVSRLTMGNDTHVTDVSWPVHEAPDLIYCEVTVDDVSHEHKRKCLHEHHGIDKTRV